MKCFVSGLASNTVSEGSYRLTEAFLLIPPLLALIARKEK